MKNVIFVCTGNICRSPMAEGLLRHRAPASMSLSVSSAGLAAGQNMPPSQNSITAMRELGIDISQQRSRNLDAGSVEAADFLLVMTYGHLDAILMLYPEAAEKTFLVRHFMLNLKPLERDISDPIGQSLDVYRRCRDEIDEAIPSIIEHLSRA